MPTLDLALGHRVVGSPADVGHVVTLQPFRQVVRDIRGAVVGQQPWPMEDPGFVEPRGIQRHFERGGDGPGPPRGAPLPRDDRAGKTVGDRPGAEPSPPKTPEKREARLPPWAWDPRLILYTAR